MGMFRTYERKNLFNFEQAFVPQLAERDRKAKNDLISPNIARDNARTTIRALWKKESDRIMRRNGVIACGVTAAAGIGNYFAVPAIFSLLARSSDIGTDTLISAGMIADMGVTGLAMYAVYNRVVGIAILLDQTDRTSGHVALRTASEHRAVYDRAAKRARTLMQPLDR